MAFKLMYPQTYPDCVKQVKAATIIVAGTIIYESIGAAPAITSAVTPGNFLGLAKTDEDNSLGLIGAKNVTFTPVDGVWLEADCTGTPVAAQIGTVAEFTDAATIAQDATADTGEIGFAIKAINGAKKKVYGYFVAIP